MLNPEALLALCVGLSVIATLLTIRSKVSSAISEFVVCLVLQGATGAEIGPPADTGAGRAEKA